MNAIERITFLWKYPYCIQERLNLKLKNGKNVLKNSLKPPWLKNMPIVKQSSLNVLPSYLGTDICIGKKLMTCIFYLLWKNISPACDSQTQKNHTKMNEYMGHGWTINWIKICSAPQIINLFTHHLYIRIII